MDPQFILTIIAIISAAGFLFDNLLEYLNLRHMRPEVPPSVADYYDAEKYRKSLAYHRETTRFSFLTGSLSFAVGITLLLGGGYGWIDGQLREITQDSLYLPLLFFAVLGLAADILSLPFQLYSVFVIEEKYGFNRTTRKTFVTDKLKGYLLAAVIGIPLFWAFTAIIETWAAQFWVWFGLIAAAFILLVNLFYTSLILPLFNKLTPLPEGELLSAIESFGRKAGFPVRQVLVMDGSKRTSKANAFFTGLGRQKKVVLFDTLIAKHSTDELVSVLAHEVGHYKKKHIVWGYVLSVIQVFFTLWVLSMFVFSPGMSLAMGGSTYAIHLNLLAFGILYSPVSAVTGLVMTLLSRKNEFEADAYAKKAHSAKSLASALKKLSVDNLSNLFPHPWYVFFNYSHPPLLQRLARLEQTP
jgi:STE24 endopeptidase